MKNKMMDDIENIGIMQGFLDDAAMEEDELEEEEYSDESQAARMLDRRPGSPEILMNNLRGDMRSVDARREELADLVGYEAAAETPDSVLAMLQPVLAQGGGLGALPQSGPMAQGPQPPMMPPPGGAMGGPPPGAMPPGAPPLPPGGAPPPAGGDMAALLAAGPPPGGPAPGGPPPEMMIGPDGQPIPPEGMPPINMAEGGLVQRFKLGSDEEGVTPVDEEGLLDENGRLSSAGSLYSPELIALAQSEARSLLSQKPAVVPSLKSAMEQRLPEYQGLLGSDKSGEQAGMLFDIAGAALNFAANRGPRGEVLRGSPASRFAGAFSNLPAAIQKRVSDIEDQQLKLRLLAIQAGEKDRERIQDLNAKYDAEKRSMLNTILKAEAQRRASEARGVGSSLFGKSDWEMRVFNDTGLVQRFAAGASTPEETNLMASAITSYTEPRYQPVLDPDSKLPTGQYETLPGKRLPQFVLDAQKLRQEGAPPEAAAALTPEPRTTGQASVTPPVVEAVEAVEAPAPLLSEGAAQPTEAGTAQPTDRAVDEPAFLPAEAALAEPVNLWRDSKYIAGPFATIYGAISTTPTLGDPFSEITLARSQAEALAKEAQQAFVKSQQNSVTEQKMVNEILKLKPASFKDPASYKTHMIGLSTIIDQVIEENRKKADISPAGIGSTLSPEQRTEAREKISLLTRLRNSFGLPPAVYSRRELLQLMINQPNVTEVLINGTRPEGIDQRYTREELIQKLNELDAGGQ